jgi:hypothetical protein
MVHHAGDLPSTSIRLTLFPHEQLGIVQLINAGGMQDVNDEILPLVANAALGLHSREQQASLPRCACSLGILNYMFLTSVVHQI